jgi:hypothetical protein
VLMFNSGSTILHQGTYVIVLIGYCASLLCVWAVSPEAAVTVTVMHVLINALLYFVCMRPVELPGVVYSGALRCPTAILALCSVAGILFLLRSPIPHR